MLLEVQNLVVRYGEFRAVHGVSFTIDEGELITIIGANGAGKTSILRTLMGLQPAYQGSIKMNGVEIAHLTAHDRAKLGIGIVPEGRRLFGDMDVQENLEMGAYLVQDREVLSRRFKEVYDRFPVLYERRNQRAKTLSGGEQQMLAIGRTLMGGPTLILMDEVSLGLMPRFVLEVFKIIKELNEEGKTILLVEQNARKALAIAHRGYVLETGHFRWEGQAQQLRDNPEVQRAYLGG
ncbi:MAG: branched-chain amino acid ABC transporter ATP-binding protein [Deltaproteobacteria bacterium]|nr:MAG: branched-chain amino acid ABC transporter ATP-binding protein [Deltaproteobacteria bacterium]